MCLNLIIYGPITTHYRTIKFLIAVIIVYYYISAKRQCIFAQDYIPSSIIKIKICVDWTVSPCKKTETLC